MPKKITLIIVIAAAILLSCQQCYSIGKTRLSESEIDAKLSKLKPLPKIHYCWPPDANLLETRDSRRLYELARITHSLCVSGEWCNKEQVDNCVYICARVNKTGPSIKASLGVNFSPWHRRFGKDLPPTDRGPTYFEEIAYFEKRARLVNQWVSHCNEKYHSDVMVSAVMFDCERFEVKKKDMQWNEAIKEALDAIHVKAVAVFPNAKMIWYGRGILWSPEYEIWVKTRYWTYNEIKSPLSCSLYTVPETARMLETLRRTAELAVEKNINEVVPYVALAAGYHPKYRGHYWRLDWPYDLKYSHKIGQILNAGDSNEPTKGFVVNEWVKVINLYPGPFDERVPDWARHFIAYVRGATGVQDLNDLGYEK
jgi:hypothetical protein